MKKVIITSMIIVGVLIVGGCSQVVDKVSNSNDKQIELVKKANEHTKWEVKVSSSFKDGEITYNPENLIDGKSSTPWISKNENIKDDSIIFKTKDDVNIDKIFISNGFSENPVKFEEYSRIKRMKVEFSNGESTEFTLDDTIQVAQEFQLENPIKTNEIKFTILEVYKGTNHQNVSLGEISFNFNSIENEEKVKEETSKNDDLKAQNNDDKETRGLENDISKEEYYNTKPEWVCLECGKETLPGNDYCGEDGTYCRNRICGYCLDCGAPHYNESGYCDKHEVQ
ncbi:Uncharacterised protein [[Clostridium] sordellii]|uniref:discoidin domain-containing protein n=1 Tax=Paraclostridium sordellii TaxID=1505 RepID=UPI0005DD7EF9|nr:discoidin domain-containing protein [Paeniclostridium sordellii]CEQ11108.1 Uncharacterised protein [[Clostridium] sordellii] [Paeniclostridium sordellii]